MAKVLKPNHGYEFKKHGKELMLMRSGSGGLGVATISCACRGDGSCGIVIDTEGKATCEGTCGGGCNWVVTSLEGLNHSFLE